MRYLGPADRSRREVRRHLVAKGFSGPEADAACVRLVELGILDDERLARNAAEAALARRGEARANVASALATRGIPASIVETVLPEVFADEEGTGEVERAIAVGAHRLRVLHGTDVSIRRRLGAYLARRGYPMDVVVEAVNRLTGRDGENLGLVDEFEN